jgi:hypothetical protein
MKHAYISIFSTWFSTLAFGQTTESGFLQLQVKDSTGQFAVFNASVTLVSNDTAFLSASYQTKLRLYKSLSDTVVVTHWYLGATKLAFEVKPGALKQLTITLPKSCLRIPDSSQCPICNEDNDVVEIVYGKPTRKTMKAAENGKFRLGGCVIDRCSPKKYCKKDNFEF